MFDFQKLQVYQKAKEFNKAVRLLLQTNNFDRTTHDQLRRAAFSVMLNIAEGSARFSAKDRRHYMVISRGSVFECVAIFEYLQETNQIDKAKEKSFYDILEEISKMLYALIKNLEVKKQTY